MSKKPLKALSFAKPVFQLDSSSDDDVVLVSETKSSPHQAGLVNKGKGKQSAAAPKKKQKKRHEELWVDHYAPQSLDELAVHVKKVADVRTWLTEAFSPVTAKYRKLLVLSGPTGSAKTATLRLLAEEQGIVVKEYRTPDSRHVVGEESNTSLVNHFTQFLHSSIRGTGLAMTDSSTVGSSSTSSKATLPPRQLLLLEDLPNVSHWQTKQALQSSLRHLLSLSSSSSGGSTVPVVLIISQALGHPGADAQPEGGMYKRDESVDAHTVVGATLLNSPGCKHITFNPIAVTILKKALKRTLDLIFSSTSPPPLLTQPTEAALDLVVQTANGDIRSALMTLQFLAATGTNPGGGGKNGGAGGKKRKRGKEEPTEKEKREITEAITSRENSLFLFHALGKVLYNKRWDQSEADDKKDLARLEIIKPPDVPPEDQLKMGRHLKAFKRNYSKVDPSAVFLEVTTETDVFVTYVHHNYLPFTEDIGQIAGIMEYMSLADATFKLTDEGERTSSPLTQQYLFHTLIRGTLISLPSPPPKSSGPRPFRKSEYWDTLRSVRTNEEIISSLICDPDGMMRTAELGFVRGQLVEDNNEERDATIGTMRSSRSLRSEFIPWVGLIERHNKRLKPSYGPFVKELAKFPDRVVALPGDNLGENEGGVPEQEEEPATEEDGEQEGQHEAKDVLMDGEDGEDPSDLIEEV